MDKLAKEIARLREQFKREGHTIITGSVTKHGIYDRPVFTKVRTAEEINRGLCADFATYLEQNLPKHLAPKTEFVMINNGEHDCLKIGNKYYDAECPSGVVSKRNLPFYIRKRQATAIEKAENLEKEQT